MGCIEADSHSLLLMNSLDDLFNLLKGVADLCSLSSSIFQEEDDRILHPLKGLVNSIDNSFYGFILRGFHSMTDMDNEISDS